MLGKRKLKNRTAIEKHNDLQELEKILSSKEVPANYGVWRNTISTWVKNR